MKSPFGLLGLMALFLILALGACWAAYTHGKTNYYAIGFNDGTVDAKYKTLKTVEAEIGALPACDAVAGASLPSRFWR